MGPAGAAGGVWAIARSHCRGRQSPAGLHGAGLPGVRLVAGSAPDCGLVTRQKEGSPGQGGLTAAREVTREMLPVASNLTGHRQAEPAETLRGQAIALAFATATAAPDGSYYQAQTWQRWSGAGRPLGNAAAVSYQCSQ